MQHLVRTSTPSYTELLTLSKYSLPLASGSFPPGQASTPPHRCNVTIQIFANLYHHKYS